MDLPYWRYIQVTVYSLAGEEEESAWRTDFLPDVPGVCILPPALSCCKLASRQERRLWIAETPSHVSELELEVGFRQLWEGGSHLLKLDSVKAVNCPSCYSYRAERIFGPCVLTHLHISAVVSPIHLNSSAVPALWRRGACLLTLSFTPLIEIDNGKGKDDDFYHPAHFRFHHFLQLARKWPLATAGCIGLVSTARYLVKSICTFAVRMSQEIGFARTALDSPWLVLYPSLGDGRTAQCTAGYTTLLEWTRTDNNKTSRGVWQPLSPD